MLEISGVGAVTALAAGAISFLSPCVLPLVPGYLAYIAGNTNESSTRSIRITTSPRTLMLALCFVLGFSTVFIALGASASGISHLLLAYRYEANLVGGAVIILFGIFMTELIPIPWLGREHRLHALVKGGRPSAAYTLGLAFGFGWTPCIGPVLGTILTVSALSATISSGLVLLGLYSIGLGVPFLAAALFTTQLTTILRPMRRPGRILQTVAGVAMIAMGGAMMTGRISDFSFWLLDRFPAFGAMG